MFEGGFFQLFGKDLLSHPWGLCEALFGVLLTFSVGLYEVSGGSPFRVGNAAPGGESVYVCFVALSLALAR